jgi:3D (Asp-Asp-Asp) domain-containing protein
MDTETYLKQLSEQQKANKKLELEQTKQQALDTIAQEEAKITPAYAKQKQTANVQSQIAAKNFAEYLANRGQTSQGIATQYEMSRQNTLGNTISGINTAENEARQTVANNKNIAETNYLNNLTNYNNAADLQLTQDIASAKQAEAEAAAKQAQQDFENQLAIAKYNLSLSKTNNSTKTTYNTSAVPYTTGLVGDVRSDGYTYYNVGGETYKIKTGTNPFTNTVNPDAKNGTFSLNGVAGAGYQPNNVGTYTNDLGKKVVNKLSKSGAIINYNGQNQNVWKSTTGSYYFWDGKQNKYLKLTNAEKKSLGLK